MVVIGLFLLLICVVIGVSGKFAHSTWMARHQRKRVLQQINVLIVGALQCQDQWLPVLMSSSAAPLLSSQLQHIRAIGVGLSGSNLSLQEQCDSLAQWVALWQELGLHDLDKTKKLNHISDALLGMIERYNALAIAHNDQMESHPYCVLASLLHTPLQPLVR